MNYKTKYSLDVYPEITDRKDIKKFLAFSKDEDYISFRYELPYDLEDIFSFLLDEIEISISSIMRDIVLSWDNHMEELTQLSIILPDYLFILYGEGEDPTDIWKKYFKNGKHQVALAKIEFDEFDENKLKFLLD